MQPDTKKYIKIAVIFGTALIVCISFYFLILRHDGFSSWIGYLVNIIKPFIYGAVMAYLLAPLTGRLEKFFFRVSKGKRKGLCDAIAAFCALLVGVLLIIAVFVLIIPQLITSVAGIVRSLPGDIKKIEAFLQETLNRDPLLLKQAQEYLSDLGKTLNEFLNKQVIPNIKTIGVSVMGGVASVIAVFKNIMLGVIIALYMLLKRRQFLAQGKLIMNSLFGEKICRLISQEAAYADRMFNGFFVGKLKDSAIIGVICFIGCLILGYRSPILIAVIIGVTNIIPFFGPFIGAVPCALLLLIENPMHCLTFLIFIIILQTLDGNVIGPKILGDSTGLSSFWVLFSILFFGAIWGIVGMIVGVPLFAVIYDIIKKLVYRSLNRKGKKELLDDYRNEFHGQQPKA